LYADRSQVCSSFDFQYPRFFGIRNITPVVNHSDIRSSSINLLNIAAICLYVAVICLSQKFDIWSLPGAFQFNVVLSASATSFSLIGFNSVARFCWYWFLSSPPVHYVEIFSIYFSPEVLHFFSTWCIIHIGLCLPKTVIKFLAVCHK